MALTVSLFQSVSPANLKNVPKIAPTKEYPYREGSGLFNLHAAHGKYLTTVI